MESPRIPEPHLDEIDRDGALLETRELAAESSRRAFIRRAGMATGAVLAAGLATSATARAQSKNDIAILNYALSLEELQAAFYTEAERLGQLTGPAARATRVVGPVERAHVDAFRRALGSAAIEKPAFDFGGVTENQGKFLQTAVAFEDLAVAAYKGQAPLIESPELLSVAVSIHSVEARHAAWMRRLVGILPAARAFDDATAKPEILRIVASTGFVTSPARTGGRGRPRFTG
jgi:Ferritin-like domain